MEPHAAKASGRRFAVDFGRGLLLAAPVLGLAALAFTQVARVRSARNEAEAKLLGAQRRVDELEQNLRSLQKSANRTVEERLKAAAAKGESREAAEERQNQVITFLKQELASKEKALEALNTGPGAKGGSAETVSRMVAEIARQNVEIEQLRQERDALKKKVESR